MSATDNPPPGFVLMAVRSEFPNHIGRFYLRADGGRQIVGLRAEQHHCNSDGVVHGGLLLAMADFALSFRGPGDIPPRITMALNAEFAGAARRGDWIEAHVDVQKVGKSSVFANCFLCVGDTRIVRAGGVFKIVGLDRPPPRG